jgi:hypothetical protein
MAYVFFPLSSHVYQIFFNLIANIVIGFPKWNLILCFQIESSITFQNSPRDIYQQYKCSFSETGWKTSSSVTSCLMWLRTSRWARPIIFLLCRTQQASALRNRCQKNTRSVGSAFLPKYSAGLRSSQTI